MPDTITRTEAQQLEAQRLETIRKDIIVHPGFFNELISFFKGIPADQEVAE